MLVTVSMEDGSVHSLGCLLLSLICFLGILNNLLIDSIGVAL